MVSNPEELPQLRWLQVHHIILHTLSRGAHKHTALCIGSTGTIVRTRTMCSAYACVDNFFMNYIVVCTCSRVSAGLICMHNMAGYYARHTTQTKQCLRGTRDKNQAMSARFRDSPSSSMPSTTPSKLSRSPETTTTCVTWQCPSSNQSRGKDNSQHHIRVSPHPKNDLIV